MQGPAVEKLAESALLNWVTSAESDGGYTPSQHLRRARLAGSVHLLLYSIRGNMGHLREWVNTKPVLRVTENPHH